MVSGRCQESEMASLMKVINQVGLEVEGMVGWPSGIYTAIIKQTKQDKQGKMLSKE